MHVLIQELLDLTCGLLGEREAPAGGSAVSRHAHALGISTKGRICELLQNQT